MAGPLWLPRQRQLCPHHAGQAQGAHAAEVDHRPLRAQGAWCALRDRAEDEQGAAGPVLRGAVSETVSEAALEEALAGNTRDGGRAGRDPRLAAGRGARLEEPGYGYADGRTEYC